MSSGLNERPIDPHSIPAGRTLLQVAWRDEDGNLYVKQAVGDARHLCVDMTVRSRLVWSFVAAWISGMAATFGVEVAEIEMDPDRMRKSAIVGPGGKPYTLPDDNDGGGNPRSH